MYEVRFHCPACGEIHMTGVLLRFLRTDLEGKSVIDAYAGRDLSPKLKAFRENAIMCQSLNQRVMPELDQYSLVIPL